MTDEDTLWEGDRGRGQTRIRKISEDDCVVEVLVNGEWAALDDDASCADAYMAAYLDSRKVLARLYDRDMGNLNSRQAIQALEDAARVLRLPED